MTPEGETFGRIGGEISRPSILRSISSQCRFLAKSDACTFCRGGSGVPEAARSDRVEDAVLVGEGEWGRVIGRLKQEVGEAAYRSWLKSMRFERVADGEGVIAVPTRFLRNWVATHYADRLLALWRTENEQVNRLAIIVEPRVAAFAQAKDEEMVTAPAALAEPLAMPDIVEVGANLSAPLDPRFTFENFIVGKPNELAHAAARRVAEACVSPAHSVPFNPLFLYGGVGLGKTHLMHAIAWHVRRQAPGRKVIYLSAEKFMYQFIRSLLGWGLAADIHPTTYELRLGILQSKAEQTGLRLPQKVMEFLAHKIVSNVRELEGALNRIIAQMQLVGREITLEGAQDLLHDLLRANERRVTIDEIQRRVAEHFNIKMAEMTSSRRARAVARPRQVAMYLSKQLTSRSLPEIGRKFGGRDHTTVIHAVKKIEELIESDSALAEDVELLRRMLQS